MPYPAGWERMGEYKPWELMWRKREAADINFLHSLSDYTKGALLYMARPCMRALRGQRPDRYWSGRFASFHSVQGACPLRLLPQAIPPLRRIWTFCRAAAIMILKFFKKVSERRNNLALPMPLVMEGLIPKPEKEVSLWRTKKALPDLSSCWRTASW